MKPKEEKTIDSVLSQACQALTRKRLANPTLEAEVLLAHALGCNRVDLFAHGQRVLGLRESNRFKALLERRRRGEPVAYITGKREFWSLEMAVSPAVLIPRPETETLVQATLEIVPQRFSSSQIRLLELGTGCGAAAIALARELKETALWATDRSARALKLAAKNAKTHGVAARIAFLEGNLFEPLSFRPGFFHVILSNPPYVSQEEMGRLPEEVKHEPRGALEGGAKGLRYIRKIIEQAPDYLTQEGVLLLEIGQGQQEDVARLIQESGAFSWLKFKLDLAGIERVAVAFK